MKSSEQILDLLAKLEKSTVESDFKAGLATNKDLDDWRLITDMLVEIASSAEITLILKLKVLHSLNDHYCVGINCISSERYSQQLRRDFRNYFLILNLKVSELLGLMTKQQMP